MRFPSDLALICIFANSDFEVLSPQTFDWNFKSDFDAFQCPFRWSLCSLSAIDFVDNRGLRGT